MARPKKGESLLSLELICQTALALIDRDGLDSLSMRKLAASLDVTPRALYHYVPTKSALIGAVYDQLLDDHTTPVDSEQASPDTWQEQLRVLAGEFRRLWQAHPNLAPLLLDEAVPTETELSLYTAVAELLREAGVSAGEAPLVARILTNFLIGFVVAELRGEFREAKPDHAFGVALDLLATCVAGASSPSPDGSA